MLYEGKRLVSEQNLSEKDLIFDEPCFFY